MQRSQNPFLQLCTLPLEFCHQVGEPCKQICLYFSKLFWKNQVGGPCIQIMSRAIHSEAEHFVHKKKLDAQIRRRDFQAGSSCAVVSPWFSNLRNYTLTCSYHWWNHPPWPPCAGNSGCLLACQRQMNTGCDLPIWESSEQQNITIVLDFLSIFLTIPVHFELKLIRDSMTGKYHEYCHKKS